MEEAVFLATADILATPTAVAPPPALPPPLLLPPLATPTSLPSGPLKGKGASACMAREGRSICMAREGDIDSHGREGECQCARQEKGTSMCMSRERERLNVWQEKGNVCMYGKGHNGLLSLSLTLLCSPLPSAFFSITPFQTQCFICNKSLVQLLT